MNAIFDILFLVLKISVVITIFFLAAILILNIFKKQEGIVVLPFETPKNGGMSNYNGKAISDLITSELSRIRKINYLEFEAISFESDTLSDPMGSRNVGWSDKPLPTLINSGEKTGAPKLIPLRSTLESNVADIGSVTIGSATLSLGSIIMAFKRICPGGSCISIMTGSLQIYGNVILIIASLEKSEVYTWEVRRNIEKKKSPADQLIPSMIRDLSYKIYYDLAIESEINILRRKPN